MLLSAWVLFVSGYGDGNSWDIGVFNAGLIAPLDVDSAVVIQNHLESSDNEDNESEMLQVEMTFDMLRIKTTG